MMRLPIPAARLAVLGVVACLVTGCSITKKEPGKKASHSSSSSRNETSHPTKAQKAPPAPMGVPHMPQLAKAVAKPGHEKQQVIINSAHRDSNGLLTVIWTLKNNSGNDFSMIGAFQNYYHYSGADGVQGVTVVDEKGKVRYNPLEAPDGHCTCTEFTVGGTDDTVKAGKQLMFYDTYAVPKNVSKVTVEFKGYEPVKVPVK